MDVEMNRSHAVPITLFRLFFSTCLFIWLDLVMEGTSRTLQLSEQTNSTKIIPEKVTQRWLSLATFIWP